MQPPLKHLYLIDGSGFIFRAFHALPPLTRPDGVQVGAVYGFITMLLKIIQEAEADHLAVIFDAGQKTFRHHLYDEYKAHRPPPPPELIPQFQLIWQACEALSVPHIRQEGYEADDIIATYASQAVTLGAKVTLVSSDKDLMQLVSPNIEMRDPLKNKIIGPEHVREKFGVGPDKVIEVQALIGDSSDNIPGVPGIGPKTAAELITHYGDLETLLQRAREIQQPKRRQMLLDHQEAARLSYQLVTLRKDVPLPETLDSFSRRPLDPQRLLPFLEQQHFKTLAAKFSLKRQGPSSEKPLAEKSEEKKVPSYELVLTRTHLEQWIREASLSGCVALDTETDSLNPLQANLVGVSLCCFPGKACYIPLQHRQASAQLPLRLSSPQEEPALPPSQIPLQEALDLLAPLLRDPSVLKIGHNIKYDRHIFKTYGVEVTPLADTMVLSYILRGSQHGHGMDELARRYLQHETITFKDVCGTGKDQITFDRVPLPQARDYAAEDAEVTRQLYDLFKPELRQEGLLTVYETLDRPLIPVLFDMERHGIRVNPSHLQTLSLKFAEKIKALETEIYTLAGQTFTIGSPKQLGILLFEVLKCKGEQKNKSGGYKTDADVLERLASEGHLIADKVLQWRQLSKLKSTYTDALLQEINPRTGRVHTSYGMTMTSTGRLSSSTPNLQNIPVRSEEGRLIRRAFIAEPGMKLVSLDYSQIELRLLTHMAGIPSLQEAFRQGIDIHALTASQVFGLPLSQMTPSLRSKAKAINFGIIYGISPFGLAQQLGISRGEAKEYMDIYFAQYPGIQEFMQAQKELARRQGYVETLLGRRIFIPGIHGKGPLQSMAERQAINAPLQGTNADIIKRAMIQISAMISDRKLKVRMLLQVHDELIFEADQAVVDDITPLFKNVMEGVVSLSVPLVVDVGVGDTWDDVH